ncbi:MAG TPA: TRAP transporter substrate-binding protein DctP [Pseudolabrys sp.]|nr:TRAP transporter substrate-binding protein DctP [Pseudolabrys sp.]
MLRAAMRFIVFMTALSPAAILAAPVTLKLSFFTSDRSAAYECQVRPFVDAVNAEGADIVEIKVLFGGRGAINTAIPEQPRLVRDGSADLAIIVPGLSAGFGDTAVLQMPGLYRDEREASLVFTRLVEAGALEGYGAFYVAGAYVSAAENVHSRRPLPSLGALKGQTIRVNNAVEAAVLRRLGATAVLLPINRAMDGLSDGTLDGVTVPPSMVFEFGFGRVTEHHYLIELGGAPVALVMNRDRFASLPAPAQEIIRKFSGERLAERAAACAAAKNRDVLEKLNASPRRMLAEPTASDLVTIRDIESSVLRDWAAESPHNRELLERVTTELAKLRKETPQ